MTLVLVMQQKKASKILGAEQPVEKQLSFCVTG